MSKHTPGPWGKWWRCKDGLYNDGNDYVQIAGRPDFVAQVRIASVTEADICLIAAAPDLLEALSSIDIYLSDTLSGRVNPDPATYKQWLIDGIAEARNRARAAIAKATGETND